MPKLADIFTCTGCSACMSGCPKDAIEMRSDSLGFKFPDIDVEKCIECKKCERICPVIAISDVNKEKNKPVAYAAQLFDANDVINSQSGGAFKAIADYVLGLGGMVYGAAFDDTLNVVHKRIDCNAELNQLRYSKYVQSDVRDTFREVVSDLKNNLKVLYTGTPCQIAGLKAVVPGNLQKNLITVDIVCHGVPSPAVYRGYIAYQEKKHHSKVERFIFRDKQKFGWRSAKERLIFANGKEVSSYDYNFLFQRMDLLARRACDGCRWCNLDRAGDLTIADCWGWEKLHNQTFDEKLGVSLILVNNVKGANTLSSVNNLNKVAIDLENVMQRNLYEPTHRNTESLRLLDDFVLFGFEYIHRKYGYTLKNRVRYRVRKQVKRVRKLLSKIIAIINK